ncbi:hypothetical protein EB796_007555 [Bugula neritina]|uniref:Uncharacterized protein n=1 Tax=Bugula neritina TaxID=10212 RepID=A0A7J7K7H7_BUGNE|nr:hypothetical protein EB796_007555 [Bugula neritina]
MCSTPISTEGEEPRAKMCSISVSTETEKPRAEMSSPQYQRKAKSPEPKCPRSEEPLFSTQCLPQSHWAPCDNTPSGFDAIGTLDSPLGSDSTNSEEDFYN